MPSSLQARHIALGLLALAAFLAPIVGGQLLVDIKPIEPGVAAAWHAIVVGGEETPTLSHCLVGLLVAAAICLTAARLKVVHLPSGPILGTMVFFGALIALSLVYTEYRATSLTCACEWVVYLTAFFAAAAIAGHGLGPRVLMGAVVVGCFALSALGIREYCLQPDPNWRIFANWVNPNALAGMLVLGLFCALGTALAGRSVVAPAAGAATVFIGAALLFTQSRGALVAVAVGLVVFLAGIIGFGGAPTGGRRTPWSTTVYRCCTVAVCLTCAFILFFALFAAVARRAAAPGSAGGPSALSRISTAPDQAREQSSAFRLLLWKGCWWQFRQDIAGTGIGTYRYHSTRSGLVQQTQLAHESYLQLLVEAGPLAPACLILALVIWLTQMLRGTRRMPPDSAPLRAAVIAAIGACAVHGLFDSVLYQFGIGFTFFLLLGIGLQTTADGLSPEFIPKTGRWAAAVVVCLAVLLPAHLGFARLTASQGLWHAAEAQAMGPAAGGDEQEAARESFATARSAAPFDGDIWYRSFWGPGTLQERTEYLQTATSLTPSPKYFRALASVQMAQGKRDDAIGSLYQALQEDPNNLAALLQLMRLYADAGDAAQAGKIARRLVDVESKPYVTLRALPQMVPTETFEARGFLAARQDDPSKKVDLLRPAMDGWLSFLRRTYPQIRAAAQAGIEETGGATLESAKKDVENGQSVARSLAALYRKLGRTADAAAADAADAEFAAALAKF